MPATENIGYTGKSQLMDNYGWVQNTSNLSTVRDTVDLVPSDGIDHNSLMRMIYLFRQEKGDLKKKWEWDARCRIKAICATGMVELDRSIAGYRLTPLGEELKQSPHSTTFFRGKRVLSSEEKEIFKKGLLTNPPVIRVLAVLNDSRRNGNVPLSKYEVGSQLGFVGDIGFTHFEAEYVALMGKSFNDKEGDADKWARTIISWLSQVGWVITADSVEIYGRTLPRYTTTFEVDRVLQYNAKSTTKYVPQEMLCSDHHAFPKVVQERRVSIIKELSNSSAVKVDDLLAALNSDGIEIDTETLKFDLINLKQAGILEVEDGHKYRRFVAGEVPFADKNCILFDYSAMHAFSEKTYKSLDKNYKKAFYLSRLRRYDEAFFHFSEIAKQAFKDSDYLLYYFAESNCISLRKVIKNVNTWYRCYDLDAVEALSPNDSEAENLFRRLPVEFRNIYDNLRDIHSANMLYKYSYEAFTDGQKLQKAIESGSTEFGMTSSGKAICRVNDYLHFLLGNGIIADVFSEYRSAVKNLMSLLVYKYSTQGKKVLHEQPFPFIDGNDVYFDEIDFHCFIEYFDAKEIIALLSKYHIETIEFQNMASIENAVNNLLDYYSYAVKSSKNNIDVIGLQTQIKNCLALLRYVSISQGLVDKICGFILTQEFREILINDKVLFLDRQLVHRKMYSKTTSKIVENTLISYLDKHIAALKKGERFELFSASTGINYCNLVHYISAPEEKYYSRRLSMRISQIINNNLSQMYYQITQHYCGYVSKNQQKKLITWANKLIQMNFSFDLFKMLVQCDARISKAAKTQLKVYLKQRIDAAKNKNNNGVVVYPTKQPYEELDQVGYWCLLNVLKAKDFQEFLGNSEAFDFYCEYAKFDFSRFDVSWLLNLYPHTLEQIAKNAKVKERVRVAIATTLDGEAIAPSDSQRLQSILVKHFC